MSDVLAKRSGFWTIISSYTPMSPTMTMNSPTKRPMKMGVVKYRYCRDPFSSGAVGNGWFAVAVAAGPAMLRRTCAVAWDDVRLGCDKCEIHTGLAGAGNEPVSTPVTAANPLSWCMTWPMAASLAVSSAARWLHSHPSGLRGVIG